MISLPRSFDSRKNSNPDHYNCAYNNPLRRHMHQVRPIRKPDNQNSEPASIKSKRHKNSSAHKSAR
jgi:hypothetical protein